MNKDVIFTNDVELTSIVNNTQSIETGELVAKIGLPQLLDLYAEYNYKCTFFVTADYAKSFPASVRNINQFGHEIGNHGAAHGHDDALDRMSFAEQLRNLTYSKQALEDIIGDKVISFRAPALRTNSNTPRALIEAGFRIDSSVASQRFDFFFSFGSKEKLSWLTAPRSPYYCSIHSLAKRGSTDLLEVPLISFLYPYIGTTLRISPFVTSIFRIILVQEANHFKRFPMFLVHPNELISETADPSLWSRRSKYAIDYILKEKLRTVLKRRNLGKNAVILLKRELEYFKLHNYHGIRLVDVYNQIIKEKANE